MDFNSRNFEIFCRYFFIFAFALCLFTNPVFAENVPDLETTIQTEVWPDIVNALFILAGSSACAFLVRAFLK